jgi:hypothetical protein
VSIKPHRQDGFALLLVLVLVLLAGAALTGAARVSSRAALNSLQAVEDLQRRWATTSCRYTLLRNAEAILDQAEQGVERSPTESTEEGRRIYANPPTVHLWIRCTLAGVDYDLILTDEQAKVEVNRLIEHTDLATAQMALTRLLGGMSAGPHRLALRTTERRAEQGVSQSAAEIGSFGQVFERVSPEVLLGSEQRPGLASMVTCWGDGRLNIRRAPAEVLQTACEREMGPRLLRSLIAERDEDPYRPLPTILAELPRTDDREKVQIQQCVTDDSRCYGLWVVARGRQRSWYTLTIDVGGSRGLTGQRHEFVW